MLKTVLQKLKCMQERRRLRIARERVFAELDQIYALRKHFDKREPMLVKRANDIAIRELNLTVPGRTARSQ